MKKTQSIVKMTRSVAALLLCALMAVSVIGSARCEAEPVLSGLWDDAVYTEDTELGEGAKTVVLELCVEDAKITFTVHTDLETVGAALMENELIAGEEGPYGLYVKVVNGITADYDIDQSYWAFYINGEYAMSGVDTTAITEGAVYQLVYTR